MMTEQFLDQSIQLSPDSRQLVAVASARQRQGKNDLANLFSLAQTRIDNRNYLQSKHDRFHKEYLKTKYSYDQQFLVTHQSELQKPPVISAESLPQTEFLQRLTEFFYQQRDQIIANFRREFSLKPPYNKPPSIFVLKYIFETHQEKLHSILGPDLLSQLPKPINLIQFYLQNSYSDHFIPDRTIDLNEKESVMAFYGQFIASLTNLSSVELNEQKEALEEIKQCIPELPPRNNLALIPLKQNPELLSSLNIHAIQRFFQLRINQVAPQSLPSMPGNQAIQHEYSFSEFILGNYLCHHEFQDIQKQYEQFLQIPVSSPMDKLRKLFGKPTLRQNFIARLPANTDKQGLQLYERIQFIDYLSPRSAGIEKGDQPLIREIAFLFRLKLLETLPDIDLSSVPDITVNQLFV